MSIGRGWYPANDDEEDTFLLLAKDKLLSMMRNIFDQQSENFRKQMEFESGEVDNKET